MARRLYRRLYSTSGKRSPRSVGVLYAISGGADRMTNGSSGDVQAKIAASALNGDNVLMPAGTFDWIGTAPAVTVDRGVGLFGAGMDSTILRDGVTRTSSLSQTPMLRTSAPEGQNWRLSAFAVVRSPTPPAFNSATVLALDGFSKAFRVDNCRFMDTSYNALKIIRTGGHLNGVIDHNEFGSSTTPLTPDMPSYNGVSSRGNNSWAAPVNWGSSDFIFIEDNACIWGDPGTREPLTDCDLGGRFVVRYNLMHNMNAETHGTESGYPNRGARAVEVYENDFETSVSNIFALFNFRAGSGVVFNNRFRQVPGSSGSLTKWVQVTLNRENARFESWGPLVKGLWDDNDATIYASGTHTGPANSDKVLNDTTKNWTTNQWRSTNSRTTPYTIYNATQNWGSNIDSNTSNSITILGNVSSQPRLWQIGDSYQILICRRLLDQPGNGSGSLVIPPGNLGWPNQSVDGIYIWNNTSVAGSPTVSLASNDTPHCRLNTELFYFAKPGYTPYQYPHPLVTGAPPEPPPPVQKDPTSGALGLVGAAPRMNLGVRPRPARRGE